MNAAEKDFAQKIVRELDRGSREFPIQGDYVGRNITVRKDRRIRVNWQEITGTGDFVYSAPTPKTKDFI